MAGKKKDIKGGMFGFIPKQPKYNPETVSNETFNELFRKLEREQSFLNKLRTKQRFKHFLTILNHKLQSNGVNNTEKKKLQSYFEKINNKYKNNLSVILSNDNRDLYNSVKKKILIEQALIEQALKKFNNIYNIIIEQSHKHTLKSIEQNKENYKVFNQAYLELQKYELSEELKNQINEQKIVVNEDINEQKIYELGKKIIDNYKKSNIHEFTKYFNLALIIIDYQIQSLNKELNLSNNKLTLMRKKKQIIIDALKSLRENYIEMKQRLEEVYSNRYTNKAAGVTGLKKITVNKGADVVGFNKFTDNNGAGVAGLNNKQIEPFLKNYTDNNGADVVGLTNKQMESFVKNFTDKKRTNTTISKQDVEYVLSMFNECYKSIKKFKLGRIRIIQDAELENAELKEYFKNLYEGFYASYFDLMLKFNFSDSHKEILYKKKLEIDKYYNQNKTNEKSKNSFIKNAVNKIKVDYKTPLFPRPNLHNA